MYLFDGPYSAWEFATTLSSDDLIVGKLPEDSAIISVDDNEHEVEVSQLTVNDAQLSETKEGKTLTLHVCLSITKCLHLCNIPVSSAEDRDRHQRAPSKKKKVRTSKVAPPALSAECFVVSSRQAFDQTKLLRALETRVSCATFSRVQTATSINRVVENIRPHQVIS